MVRDFITWGTGPSTTRTYPNGLHQSDFATETIRIRQRDEQIHELAIKLNLIGPWWDEVEEDSHVEKTFLSI